MYLSNDKRNEMLLLLQGIQQNINQLSNTIQTQNDINNETTEYLINTKSAIVGALDIIDYKLRKGD